MPLGVMTSCAWTEGFRLYGLRSTVYGLGFAFFVHTVQGVGLRVIGYGLWPRGSGFGVQGL